MKSNWIALAVTLSLTVGASGALAAATSTFSDVKSNWAQRDINKMVNQDIMTGYNDGLFHPEAWVSREDFVTMAGKTLGLSADKATTVPSFNSVAQNAWNFGPVDNQAWLSSYPSSVEKPDNPVRRVEALSALAGALNKPMVSDEEANKILSKYQDASLIPVTSRRDVATAIQYKLFAEDPQYGKNMIDPLRPVNRAETATMLDELENKKDIAIVKDGQMVAGATPNGAGMPNQAATSGTSAVSGASETVPATTPEAAEQTSKLGFARNPWRNSADTIPIVRSVNVTPAPSTMDAVVPVTLAPNTTFMGTVAKSLYSNYNKPGDPVMLIVDHPILDANGRVIAPAGSHAMGFVNSIVSRNQTNNPGQIGLTFNGLVTPDGQVIPINAAVNNTDGILRAGEQQGIVYRPYHSVDALRGEINTASGSWVGNEFYGKAAVLDQPLVNLVSNRPLDPMDMTPNDLLIGVGDRLQLRLDSAGPGTVVNNKLPSKSQLRQMQNQSNQSQTQNQQNPGGQQQNQGTPSP